MSRFLLTICFAGFMAWGAFSAVSDANERTAEVRSARQAMLDSI